MLHTLYGHVLFLFINKYLKGGGGNSTAEWVIQMWEVLQTLSGLQKGSSQSCLYPSPKYLFGFLSYFVFCSRPIAKFIMDR